MNKLNLRSRLILAATAATFFLSVISSAPAIAATESDSESIGQMEDRFFERQYPNEATNDRLNRLDQFVFGADQTGADAMRIANLVKAIGNPDPGTQQRQSASSSTPASSGSDQDADQSKPKSSVPSFDYGNYPRVATLEKHLLGKTFSTDSLPARISRLETKAFGKPSSSDDYADRLDKLDDYARKHDLFGESKSLEPPLSTSPASYAPTSIASNWSNYGSGSDDSAPAKPVIENPFAPGAVEVKGTQMRIAAMEKFVFGKQYFARSLDDRVGRLEHKLTPWRKDTAKLDLATRVDNLWSMLDVANTIKSAPTASKASTPTQASAASSTRIATTASSDAATSQPQSKAEESKAVANPDKHHWLHDLAKVAPLLSTPGYANSDDMPLNPYTGLPGYQTWLP